MDHLRFLMHETAHRVDWRVNEIMSIIVVSQERSVAPEKSDHERYCDGYTKRVFVEEGSDARSALGSFSSFLAARYRKKTYRSDDPPLVGVRRSDLCQVR